MFVTDKRGHLSASLNNDRFSANPFNAVAKVQEEGVCKAYLGHIRHSSSAHT